MSNAHGTYSRNRYRNLVPESGSCVIQCTVPDSDSLFISRGCVMSITLVAAVSRLCSRMIAVYPHPDSILYHRSHIVNTVELPTSMQRNTVGLV